MMKNNIKKIFLFGIILFFAVQAHSKKSQSLEQQKGKRHKGIYFSYAPGINLTNVKITDNYGSSTFKGLGLGNDFKIGGTIKENLILHATLSGHGVYEPKIYNENSGQNGIRAEDKDFSELLIGAGIHITHQRTFYFPLPSDLEDFR